MTNNKKNLFSFVLFLVPLGFRFIPCLPLSERVRPFFLLKLSDAKQKKHLLLKRTCKKTIWKQKTIKNSRRKKSASELALFHTKKKSCITAPLFLPNKMARFNSLALPLLCAATILLVLSGGGGAWGQQEAAELAATILHLLAQEPEEMRKAVLERVMKNRCPKCFDYSPSGSFWCCYNSRGG